MESPRIDFDAIDQYGPQERKLKLDVSTTELDRYEVEAIGETSIDARAEQGDVPGEYVVSGTVTLMADLCCGRCVDPYPFAATSPFTVRYRSRSSDVPPEEEEIEISSEELDIEFYNERSVDLKALALEQIQLSVPMKPLCSAECPGLCPSCGANRNSEKCSCSERVIDERWAALQGLRADLDKKSE